MKRMFSMLCVLALLLAMITVPAYAVSDAGECERLFLTENAKDLYITKDTYLDLNGYSVAGITVADGVTAYIFDNRTGDYTVADGIYGTLTGVSGNVEAAEGYVEIAEEGALSFHKVDLTMTAMTLRPSAAGVYYSSAFAADEVVAANVECYGVALSAVEAPTAENLDSLCGYSVIYGFEAGEKSGTLLSGIMTGSNTDDTNSRNAGMEIYGSAYIRIDGTYIFGSCAVRSLQQQVEEIDRVLTSLDEVQKNAIIAMYSSFSEVMSGWDVPNLSKAAESYETEVGFVPNDITEDTFETGTSITIGELFKLADEKDMSRVGDLEVTVSPADTASTAGGVYTPHAGDWRLGTLTFSGAGKAVVTIALADGKPCVPATVQLTIWNSEVFVSRLNAGDFLYRVGNQNNVSMGTLFAQRDPDEALKNVKVTVTGISGNAAGSYTENTNWTSGWLRFSGTGVVKVTIGAESGNTESLYLEVLNAYNVTNYSELKNQNSVLLGDITMTQNGSYSLSGYTLYGNGFTFDCTNGACGGSSGVLSNYLIGLVNAHLDNVKVTGKVYTTYNAQATSDYNRALVATRGDSTITNCYLSNTASPVRLLGGSLTIKGTTVKGGSFANIDIRNGHLVTEDITTINQALGNDTAENGAVVIGMGIVVYYENVDPALTSITVQGSLTQYNCISNKTTFANSYASALIGEIMGSNYSAYHYVDAEGTKWTNAGIISMAEGMAANISLPASMGYSGKKASYYGVDGWVVTKSPTEKQILQTPGAWESAGQGVIAPDCKFDYTSKNYVAKTEGSNDYCYYDGGKVYIGMDEGDTFLWDPFILTATKHAAVLDYTVTMNGQQYAAGSKIPFHETGEYTVLYTYQDSYNFDLDGDGMPVASSRTYEKTVLISVSAVAATAQNATFTFAGDTATEKITLSNKTYVSAKGVTATDQKWGYITVSGTKIFYPIVEAQFKKNVLGTEVQAFYYVFNGTVTITDYTEGGTGTEQIYNASTLTMPEGLSVVNGMFATYKDIGSACVDISKLNKDGSDGSVWAYNGSTTVSGTTKYNGYLAHSSSDGLPVKEGTRDYDAITVAQFCYTDAAGATCYYFVGYYMPSQYTAGSGSCVAAGTMITLADGSQVAVEELTGEEMLLVWNLETGRYEAAPIVFVDKDAETAYEVIRLVFSDGTETEIIWEHGFFDVTAGRYIYLNASNAEDYIGHSFVKQGDPAQNHWETAELVAVVIETKVTTAYSPVTFGQLCYYVDGMLSMPGGIEGLFNIFEVDIETMTYDAEKMAADIEAYGLFTYEDFAAVIPEEAFYAFYGAWLKVAMGKGLLTWEDIEYMANRYVPLM